jgi:uncharacterized membrane protein YccF (DUF307 family)
MGTPRALVVTLWFWLTTIMMIVFFALTGFWQSLAYVLISLMAVVACSSAPGAGATRAWPGA